MQEIIRTHIAGIKFRPGAHQHLLGCDAGHTFTLQSEPDNQYDATAVAIMDGDMQVGYVPGFLSAKVTEVLGAVESVVFDGDKGVTITYETDLLTEPA